MHARAQASQELQQLRRELGEARPLAHAHAALQAELQGARGELREAEKRVASFDALARKAAAVFEARLGGVEKERDQLLEQVGGQCCFGCCSAGMCGMRAGCSPALRGQVAVLKSAPVCCISLSCC
jgi:hypothetical protein